MSSFAAGEAHLSAGAAFGGGEICAKPFRGSRASKIVLRRAGFHDKAKVERCMTVERSSRRALFAYNEAEAMQTDLPSLKRVPPVRRGADAVG